MFDRAKVAAWTSSLAKTLKALHRSRPAPLDQQNMLITACSDLLEDRARLVALLGERRESWTQVRTTLNELQEAVTPGPFVPRPPADFRKGLL